MCDAIAYVEGPDAAEWDPMLYSNWGEEAEYRKQTLACFSSNPVFMPGERLWKSFWM